MSVPDTNGNSLADQVIVQATLLHDAGYSPAAADEGGSGCDCALVEQHQQFSVNEGSRRSVPLTLPVAACLVAISAEGRRAPAAIAGFGAIEEHPLALLRRTHFQAFESPRNREQV